MTVLTPPPPHTRRRLPTRAGHIVFEDVPWDFFERILQQFERSGQWFRLTYDDGRLELMVPGNDHELDKTTLARLVETYALEIDVPITGAGSLLLKRESERKGLLPDECYYVNAPAPPRTPHALRTSRKPKYLDLTKHAPPDLGIEVEVSRTVVARLPVYAGLKVPEVWRERAGHVTVLLRQRGGKYKPSPVSVAFPRLPIEELNRFLAMSMTMSQHDVVKAFRDWARSTRPPGRK